MHQEFLIANFFRHFIACGFRKNCSIYHRLIERWWFCRASRL